MKMDADIVVMTVPDLENFHIKRSYVRKDIEYLYVQHGMGSVNLTYRKGALDHYDSILCPNRAQKEEILAQEKLYNLKPKKIIECGYFVLDDMIAAYEKMDKTPNPDGKKNILIAPSWQEGNIVDSCLEELLNQLKGTGNHIIVRPHPQHVRHKREKLEKLKELVSMLNGSEFNDDGTLKFINHPLIRRIQCNARDTYLTSSGRLSTVSALNFGDNFPIVGIDIDEVDDMNRVLYAKLIVYIQDKGKCVIPFVDV
jgi:hypothetical protein